MIKILNTQNIFFETDFNAILARAHNDGDSVEDKVRELLHDVKLRHDSAILEHITRFDRWTPSNPEEIAIAPELMEQAYNNLEETAKKALHMAYERIKAYHEKQLPKSWLDFEKNGSMLGQKVTPVEKAGLYIPGGKAAYPSSLLMNAIPALVAGVEELIVCTPTPDNHINELLLAAMHICGIKKAFRVGGASAIGALAYGTSMIPKVDVITGPGNIFVATAKKLVFGEVNIDMIAGPSEIGILCDESANPEWIAIDLLSQAEHDEMASSILITPNDKIALSVQKSIETWMNKLSRTEIIRKSIDERGAIIVTQTMEEAIGLMNKIAPEHLEVVTSNPFELLPKIKHAGAIFLGHYTPEPIGDYIAGPNHTLPTGSTARFYSPLSVENFLKKSSIIAMSQQGIQEIGESAAIIASLEGLDAHEQSVRVRLA